MVFLRRVTQLTSLTLVLMVISSVANADACLEVTLTGTQGGPSVFNGQAGARNLGSLC